MGKAVFTNALIEPQALAHTIVCLNQSAPNVSRFPGRFCLVAGFLHCQQKLGHHVPVDAADAFVAVHAARTPHKRFVVEDCFIEVQHGLTIYGNSGAPLGMFGQAVQLLFEDGRVTKSLQNDNCLRDRAL